MTRTARIAALAGLVIALGAAPAAARTDGGPCPGSLPGQCLTIGGDTTATTPQCLTGEVCTLAAPTFALGPQRFIGLTPGRTSDTPFALPGTDVPQPVWIGVQLTKRLLPPAALTFSMNPNPPQLINGATLVVTASRDAAPGPYLVRFIGQSGSGVQTANTRVEVRPPPRRRR